MHISYKLSCRVLVILSGKREQLYLLVFAANHLVLSFRKRVRGKDTYVRMNESSAKEKDL